MPDALYRRGWTQQTARLRAAWSADPLTRCWRCGLTLAEHPVHRSGKRQRWTAGHVDDSGLVASHGLAWSVVFVEGVAVAAEASWCNFAAGARKGNARRRGVVVGGLRTSRDWSRPLPTAAAVGTLVVESEVAPADYRIYALGDYVDGWD